MSLNNKNPPALLRLPLEIRLEIYSYLLMSPAVTVCRRPNSPDLLYISNNNNNSVQYQHRTAIIPTTALLLTCTQIKAEASMVLYSRNTFGFHDPKVLLVFLEQIGAINTGHVRALHIIVPWNQEKWAFWPSELLCKLLADAKNLRTVDVTFQRVPVGRALRKYSFGSGSSQEEIASFVVGRAMGLEFNLALALGRLQGLERVVVEGESGEGLRKRMGCKVLSRRMVNGFECVC